MARCKSPGCAAEQVEPKAWCQPCTDRLARIRGELEAGAADRQRSSGIKRWCASPACDFLAAPRSRYCRGCLDRIEASE